MKLNEEAVSYYLSHRKASFERYYESMMRTGTCGYEMTITILCQMYNVDCCVIRDDFVWVSKADVHPIDCKIVLIQVGDRQFWGAKVTRQIDVGQVLCIEIKSNAPAAPVECSMPKSSDGKINVLVPVHPNYLSPIEASESEKIDMVTTPDRRYTVTAPPTAEFSIKHMLDLRPDLRIMSKPINGGDKKQNGESTSQLNSQDEEISMNSDSDNAETEVGSSSDESDEEENLKKGSNTRTSESELDLNELRKKTYKEVNRYKDSMSESYGNDMSQPELASIISPSASEHGRKCCTNVEKIMKEDEKLKEDEMEQSTKQTNLDSEENSIEKKNDSIPFWT